MRRAIPWVAMAVLSVALIATPVVAKKKDDVERRTVDGVTLAEIKTATMMTPYYPATARVTNPVATVTLALQVDERGRVGEIDVLTSSNEGLGFEQAAADAAKGWRFLPAMREGSPVESVTMITMTFTPPSLGAPDGRVFTNARDMPFGASSIASMRDTLDLTGFYLQSHDEQARFVAAEGPPCQRGRGGNSDCLYDRTQLRQFQPDSFLAHPPGQDAGQNSTHRARGGR